MECEVGPPRRAAVMTLCRNLNGEAAVDRFEDTAATTRDLLFGFCRGGGGGGGGRVEASTLEVLVPSV